MERSIGLERALPDICILDSSSICCKRRCVAKLTRFTKAGRTCTVGASLASSLHIQTQKVHMLHHALYTPQCALRPRCVQLQRKGSSAVHRVQWSRAKVGSGVMQSRQHILSRDRKDTLFLSWTLQLRKYKCALQCIVQEGCPCC